MGRRVLRLSPSLLTHSLYCLQQANKEQRFRRGRRKKPTRNRPRTPKQEETQKGSGANPGHKTSQNSHALSSFPLLFTCIGLSSSLLYLSLYIYIHIYIYTYIHIYIYIYLGFLALSPVLKKLVQVFLFTGFPIFIVFFGIFENAESVTLCQNSVFAKFWGCQK